MPRQDRCGVKYKNLRHKKSSSKDSKDAYREFMESRGYKVGFGKRQSHSNGRRKKRKR